MSDFKYKNDEQDLDFVVHSIKKLMNEQKNSKSLISNSNCHEEGEILYLTKVDNTNSPGYESEVHDDVENINETKEKELNQCKQDNSENIFSYKEMDSLIIRLLTPMLEMWLDKNLPKLIQDILTGQLNSKNKQ